MNIKIITDDGLPLIKSIERYIKFVLPDFSKKNGPDIVLVDRGVVDKNIETINSLVAEDKIIIIFIDPGSPRFGYDVIDWFVKQPKVGKIDVLELNKLPTVYDKLVNQSAVSEISSRYLKIQQQERRVRALLHGADQQLATPELRQKWIEQARDLGFIGDDEKVIHQVKSWKPETAGEFQDVYLEGVYVDAYQTLFDNEWKLVKKTFESVANLASGKPVYVISDSDEQQLRDLLNKNNIEWLLVSKYVLRGAVLETVIDNLSADDFLKMYSINFKNYINIKDLI